MTPDARSNHQPWKANKKERKKFIKATKPNTKEPLPTSKEIQKATQKFLDQGGKVEKYGELISDEEHKRIDKLFSEVDAFWKQRRWSKP